MRKIRIAFVVHSLVLGGTDIFVLNLAKALNKDKYDPKIIIAINDGAYQENEHSAIEAGIEVFRTCDLPTLSAKYCHYKKLMKVLKETGPYDVVHSNMDMFNGINLMAAKEQGIPIRISHAHISKSQYAAREKNPVILALHSLYVKTMRQLIQKNATHFFGCSEEANQYVNKNNTAMVIHNGIDLPMFSKMPKDIDTIAKNAGIDRKRINLLTIGRHSEAKNPFFIIDIMHELKKINSNLHLIWVGKGDLTEAIKHRINELGLDQYITLLGARDDVPNILHCCDYFLFPSVFEGLGIVLIEAQAAGLDCFISETIPKMANVGKCIVLNLKDGAEAWAMFINDYINNNNNQEIDVKKLRRFGIDYTAEQCATVYDLALNGGK